MSERRRKPLQPYDIKEAERDGFQCAIHRQPAEPPPFYDDPSPTFSYAPLREAFRAGHARGLKAIGAA